MGKTTHIALLPRHWSILLLGGLHDHSSEISNMLADGSFKDWWWQSSNEEFVSVIFEALKKRRQTFQGGHEIVVLDRGTAMFEAVATAVIAIKTQEYDLSRAEATLKDIQATLDLDILYEDVAILLKQHNEVARAVQIGLSREKPPVGGRYRLYQTLLHQAVRRQELSGVYQHVIVESGPESHQTVQNQVRAIFAGSTSPQLFAPIAAHVQRIFAIGGLSESGKSTVASQIVQQLGHRAHRLKMGYLLDLASARQGADIYRSSEKQQSIALQNELEAYSRAHYWLDFLTIESVHRRDSMFWLKTWLRDKLCIVYVDAALNVRVSRNLESSDELVRKDAMKVSRGADAVKDIADFVLDNNASIDQCMAPLLSTLLY